MFLQSDVFPIVLYTIKSGAAHVERVIGTGFFISSEVFLTCQHVLRGARIKADEAGQQIGIVVKADGGKSLESLVARIVASEIAPEPYDVTVAISNYRLETPRMKFREQPVEVWQRVATYGYPINAVAGDPTDLRINLRAHKGIVQRVLSPGDLPIGPSPAAYELSFLIGTGMSGAPLFIYEKDESFVVGICASSSRTEEIDEIVEVIDGSEKYRETKLKITEFGVAHDLISLLQWQPKLLAGKSLLEASYA